MKTRIYEDARVLFKQEQNRLGEANVLSGLGDLERKLGRNEQARTAYEDARVLFKQVEDRLGEANVLRGLGDLERTLGRNERARTAYAEARVLFKQMGDRLGEANVLLGLGRLEAKSNPELARGYFQQAAHLYETLGLQEDDHKRIKELITRPQGIILVSGPTGSGKSTTLYSFLRHLYSEHSNIVTVEDPVEYQLPRINQRSRVHTRTFGRFDQTRWRLRRR